MTFNLSLKKEAKVLGKLFGRKKEQAKILVVDDEPNIRNVVSKFLKRQGYDVIVAANGKEGLAKATDEEPDIILMDVNMPVMDGRQTLNCIRNSPDLKNIPVIMLTALHEEEDVETAVSHDITDYITKPFDYAYLCEKIDRALQHEHKQKI